MSKVRQFLKTVLIYFAGSVLAKLVSFFLLPLYTSYISPEQYGTFDLVLSLINLIGPLAFFQIWDGMFRCAFDYDEKEDKYSVINHAIVAFSMGILLFVALFLGTYFYFGYQYIGYVLLYGFCFSLQYIYAYSARLFLDNKLFVLSGTANTLCSALINIVLIVGFGWDVKSLYLAPAIGCLVQIFIIELKIGVLRHFTIKNIELKRIKKMLAFSLPLCFATISYWLLSGFTKVLITDTLGSAENGLYAVANRFASMITIVVTVFQYAWNEMAYMMANDENRSQSYSMCVNLLFKTIMIGSGAACLLIKIIFPYFIGSQYSAALSIIPAVFVGASMNSMAGLFGTLFMTEKKTVSILTSTLIAAVLNIIVSIVFVIAGNFTLQIAVVSLGLSFTFLMLIRLWQLMRKFKIRINISTIISVVPLIASIAMYYLVENYYLYTLVIFAMIFFWGITNKTLITLFVKGMFSKRKKED